MAVGFIDMAKLRFGTFKGYYREPTGDKYAIRFMPPNSFKEEVIHDCYLHSLIKVEAFNTDSKYSYFMVLVAAENGVSPFIDQYLGAHGMISQLIQKMHNMSEQSAISRAALLTKQREVDRGEDTILDKQTGRIKKIDEATKREVPYGNRFGRRPMS